MPSSYVTLLLPSLITRSPMRSTEGKEVEAKYVAELCDALKNQSGAKQRLDEEAVHARTDDQADD